MLKKSHNSKRNHLKNVGKVSYSAFEKSLMGATKTLPENTETHKLSNAKHHKDDFVNLIINVKVPVAGGDKEHLLDSVLHNINSLNLPNVSINNETKTSNSTINMPVPIKVESFDDFDDNSIKEPYVDKVKHQFGIDIENRVIKDISGGEDADFLSVISEIGSTTVICDQKIENSKKFMKKINFDKVEKLLNKSNNQEVVNKDNEICYETKIDVSETQITVDNKPINKHGDQIKVLNESFSANEEFKVPEINETISISQLVTPSALKLFNSTDLDAMEVNGGENNHLQIKSENESSEEKKKTSINLNTSGSIKSEIDSCNEVNKPLSVSKRREIKKQQKQREEMAANDSVGFINSSNLMTTNEILDIVMDMCEENVPSKKNDECKQISGEIEEKLFSDSFSENENKKRGKRDDILTDSSEDSGGINNFEVKMTKRKVVLTKKKVVSNVLESSDEEEPKMSKKKKKPLPKKLKQELNIQKEGKNGNDVVKMSGLISVDNAKEEKSKKSDDKINSSSDNEIIIKKPFSPKILTLSNKKQNVLLISSSSDSEKDFSQQQNVSEYDSDEELLMLKKALYKKNDDTKNVPKSKGLSKMSELKRKDFNENKEKLGGDKKVVDSKRERLLIQNIESFKPSQISDEEKNKNEEEMNGDVLDMIMGVYNDHYNNGNGTDVKKELGRNKNSVKRNESSQNVNLELKNKMFSEKDSKKTSKLSKDNDFEINNKTDSKKTSKIVENSDDVNTNVVKSNSFEKRIDETINEIIKESNNKDFEINKKGDPKKDLKIVEDDVLKKNVEGNSNKMSENNVKNNSFEKRVEETINDVVKKSNNKDFDEFETNKKIDSKKMLGMVEDVDVLKKNVKGNSNKSTKMSENDVKSNSFEKRVEESINDVVKKSNNNDFNEFEPNKKVDSKKMLSMVEDVDVLKKNVKGNSNKTTKMNENDVKSNSFEKRVEETINDVVKKYNNKDFGEFELNKENNSKETSPNFENIKKKSNSDLENAKDSKKISKKRNGKSKLNENDQNMNKDESFERRIDETINEVIKNSNNDYDLQKIIENDSIKHLMPQESVQIENKFLTSTPKLTKNRQNEILTEEILGLINNVEETRKNKLMQRFMKRDISKSVGNHDDLNKNNKDKVELLLTSTPKSDQKELILSKNQDLGEIVSTSKISKKESDESCNDSKECGKKKGAKIDENKLITQNEQKKKNYYEISTQEIIDVIESVDESNKNKKIKKNKKGGAKSVENDDLKGGGKKKRLKTTNIEEKGDDLVTLLTSTPKGKQDESKYQENKDSVEEIVDDSSKNKKHKRSEKDELTKSSENCDDLKGSVKKRWLKKAKIDEKRNEEYEISTQEIIDIIESVDKSNKNKHIKRNKKDDVPKSIEDCDDFEKGVKKELKAKNDVEENDSGTFLTSTPKSNHQELISNKNLYDKVSNKKDETSKSSSSMNQEHRNELFFSKNLDDKDSNKKDETSKSFENNDDLKQNVKKKDIMSKLRLKDDQIASSSSMNQEHRNESFFSKNFDDKVSNKKDETSKSVENCDDLKQNVKKEDITPNLTLESSPIVLASSTKQEQQNKSISPKNLDEKVCNKRDETSKSIENCDDLKQNVKNKDITPNLTLEINPIVLASSTKQEQQNKSISPKNLDEKVSNKKDETSKSVENCDDLNQNVKKKNIMSKLRLKDDHIASSSSIDQKDGIEPISPKNLDDIVLNKKDETSKSLENCDVLNRNVKKKNIMSKLRLKDDHIASSSIDQEQCIKPISPKNLDDKVSNKKDETSKSLESCDVLKRNVKKKDIRPKLILESDEIASNSSNTDHQLSKEFNEKNSKSENEVELEKKSQSKENVQIRNELEGKVVSFRRSPRIKQPAIIKKLKVKGKKPFDDKEDLNQQDESVNIETEISINEEIKEDKSINENKIVSPRKSPRIKSKTSRNIENDKNKSGNDTDNQSFLNISEQEEFKKSLDESISKKRKKSSSPKKDAKKIKINLDFLTPRDKVKKNDKENSILNYLTTSKSSDDLNKESIPENDANKSKDTSFPVITSQEIFDQQNEICITKHRQKKFIDDAIITREAEILSDAITNQLNVDINEDDVANTSISLLLPETSITESIGDEFGNSLFVNCGEDLSSGNEDNESTRDETIKRKCYESDSKTIKSSPKSAIIKTKSKKLPPNKKIFENSDNESTLNESVVDEKMIRLIEKAVERVLERKFGKRKKNSSNNSRDSKRFKKGSFSSNESNCLEKRKLTPKKKSKKIKKANKEKYLIFKSKNNTDSNLNYSWSEDGDTNDEDVEKRRIFNMSNLTNSSDAGSSKQSSFDIRTSLVMNCLDKIHTTKNHRKRIVGSTSNTDSDIEPTDISNEFIDAVTEAQFHMNTSSSRYDMIRGLQIKIDFKVPDLHQVIKRISKGLLTKHQQDVLKEKNIEILKNHYSQKEDFLICTNFSRFCEVHNLEDNPAPFLKLTSDKHNLLTPTQTLKFLQFIGKGLDQRPLHSIYLRFKSLMAKRRRGDFTPEEDAVVLNCVKNTKKKDWAAMEYILRRPKASILKRFEELSAKNTECDTEDKNKN